MTDTIRDKARRAKQIEIMEKCFNCYAEYGLSTVSELWQFIDEIPYWTAEKHGKKYRLMYQVYTHPKYREYGQKFFAGVNERYPEYAKSLEDKLGIPSEKLTPLIFILVRACVHYALLEDEFYLKSQTEVLKESILLFIGKYNDKEKQDAIEEQFITKNN